MKLDRDFPVAKTLLAVSVVGIGVSFLWFFNRLFTGPPPPGLMLPTPTGGGPEAGPGGGPEVTGQSQFPVPPGTFSPTKTNLVLRAIPEDLDPRVGQDPQLFYSYVKTLDPTLTFAESEAIRKARFPGFF